MPFKWEMLKDVRHEVPAQPGSNYFWFFSGMLLPVVWTGSQFEFSHAPGERLPVKTWRFKVDPECR